MIEQITAPNLPHDLEAERQLLGSLLVRPSLLVQISEQVKPTDLYLEAHGFIYQALLKYLHSESSHLLEEIDAKQIADAVENNLSVEQIGGPAYVMQLSQEVMSPANVMYYVRRLKNLSLRRALMQAANSIIEDASQLSNADEISFLRNVENKILQITNESSNSKIISLRSIQKDFQEHLENLLVAKGNLSGVSSGFTELDYLTSGLKPGELIVVAARPGMGKTTFAMNVASYIAMNAPSKKNVVIYSLEMGIMELMMRFVAAESFSDHSNLKRGNVSPEEKKGVFKTIEKLCNSSLFIDDSGDLSIWECVARTRKFQVELKQQGQEIGLVIIDYLQLMSDPDARKFGRQHEVATISRNLKQLAKFINAPVLALSQMNRSVEQRRGDWARPQLSDLRESGAIEQDADIVMFIYKDPQENMNPDSLNELSASDPDKYQAIIENQGTMEMIVAKHRNGPIGSFRLSFVPEQNRFVNRLSTDSSDFV